MAEPARYPRGGFLNGMGITMIALGVAIALGALPGWRHLFAVAPTAGVVDAFTVTVGLMALHKLESHLQHEFDVSPDYLRMGGAAVADSPREAVFRVFVLTFVGMLILLMLVYHGGPWPMLLLGVWVAQGVQELHHVAKSIAHRTLYAGTASATLFTAVVLGWLLPRWTAALGWPPLVHQAIQLSTPLVVLVLWAEHRRWIRATRELGLPAPYEGEPAPGRPRELGRMEPR